MQVTPYIKFGIPGRFWVRYQVCDGFAEIVPTLGIGGRASVQLRGGDAKMVRRWMLGHFGDIEITSVSGSKMVWRNVSGANAVLEQLLEYSGGSTPTTIGTNRTPASLGDTKKESTGGGFTPTPLRFATASEIEFHRNVLGGTTEGDTKARSMDAPWTRLEVERNWDGSHEVPRPILSTAMPMLVAWSPDGSGLVTACGAWGTSRWTTLGGLTGSHRPKNCFNAAQNVIFSKHGGGYLYIGRGLEHGYPGEIYNESGVLVGGCQNVLRYLHASFMTDPCGEVSRGAKFDPWRPGSRKMLKRVGELLALVDMGCFETASEAKASGYDDLRAATASTSADCMSLETFGRLEKSIMRYAWHPSGQYLAITTGEGGGMPTCVRIVHWDQKSEVARIPGCSTLEWSSGGRYLLLNASERADAHRGVESPTSLAVWDAHSFSHEPNTAEMKERRWVDQLTGNSVVRAINADGSMYLNDSALVEIRRRHDDSVIATLPPGVKYAAWSPTTPDQLASVGGDDDPKAVRIWRLK